MARQASEWTLAIRDLLAKSGGAITHSEARPELQKLGHAIAVQPEERSADLSAFLAQLKTYKTPKEGEFDGTAREIAATLGWSTQRLNKILVEYNVDKTFRDERNGFDVTKHNWLKNNGNTRTVSSRKPTLIVGKVEKNVTVRVRRSGNGNGPQPKHRAGVVAASIPQKRRTGAASVTNNDIMAAFNFVEERGGAKEVERELAAIQNEAADLREQAKMKDAEARELSEKLELIAVLRKKVAA